GPDRDVALGTERLELHLDALAARRRAALLDHLVVADAREHACRARRGLDAREIASRHLVLDRRGPASVLVSRHRGRAIDDEGLRRLAQEARLVHPLGELDARFAVHGAVEMDVVGALRPLAEE